MSLFLVGLGIIVFGGLIALVASGKPRLSGFLAMAGAVVGGAISLAPVLGLLLGGASEALRCAWSVPYGEFYVCLDSLSAWFLAPILALSAVAAVYGRGYLNAGSPGQRAG